MKLDLSPGTQKFLGGIALITIGLVDHWVFKSSFGGNYDAGLIGAGATALGLGVINTAAIGFATKNQSK